MKLIDTDILIDYSHEIDAAIHFLEPLWDGEELAISIINAMELLIGCQNKLVALSSSELTVSYEHNPSRFTFWRNLC